MSFSADDFLAGFLNLLPRGPVWPRDPSSVQVQALSSLMPTWARLAGRDENLLVDAFPTTTVELLPEWESTLGLPDPCAGASPTLSQRQNQVTARFEDAGGQTIAHFISFAATLGYAITVTEFTPRRFGAQFGTPMYGTAWASAWQVNVPSITIAYRKFGDLFGEPYAAWGNQVLSCELNRIKPAHTALIFSLGETWDTWNPDANPLQ